MGIFSANVTNGVAQQGVKKVGVGVTEGVRPFGVDFIDRTGPFGEVVTDGVRLLVNGVQVNPIAVVVIM